MERFSGLQPPHRPFNATQPPPDIAYGGETLAALDVLVDHFRNHVFRCRADDLLLHHAFLE